MLKINIYLNLGLSTTFYGQPSYLKKYRSFKRPGDVLTTFLFYNELSIESCTTSMQSSPYFFGNRNYNVCSIANVLYSTETLKNERDVAIG
jgi:hypothetical protein